MMTITNPNHFPEFRFFVLPAKYLLVRTWQKERYLEMCFADLYFGFQGSCLPLPLVKSKPAGYICSTRGTLTHPVPYQATCGQRNIVSKSRQQRVEALKENTGDRTKLLPYTNFYVEVLTQFRIKLLHVEVLTNFRIKLLHVEVLAIFPDKTSTLTKLIKKIPPPGILKSPTIKTGFKTLKTSSDFLFIQ